MGTGAFSIFFFPLVNSRVLRTHNLVLIPFLYKQLYNIIIIIITSLMEKLLAFAWPALARPKRSKLSALLLCSQPLWQSQTHRYCTVVHITGNTGVMSRQVKCEATHLQVWRMWLHFRGGWRFCWSGSWRQNSPPHSTQLGSTAGVEESWWEYLNSVCVCVSARAMPRHSRGGTGYVSTGTAVPEGFTLNLSLTHTHTHSHTHSHTCPSEHERSGWPFSLWVTPCKGPLEIQLTTKRVLIRGLYPHPYPQDRTGLGPGAVLAPLFNIPVWVFNQSQHRKATTFIKHHWLVVCNHTSYDRPFNHLTLTHELPLSRRE